MSDRPWLAAYPRGVPAEIDPSQHASLVALFETSVRRHGGLPAFTNRGTTLSFDDVDRSSRELAAYLKSIPGMRRGDRVAVMLPNLLQSPVAIFGVLRAGFVVVNVNPLYTPPELEHQLTDSGARAIIVLENFAATLAETQAAAKLDRVIVTGVGDLFPAVERAATNFVVKHVRRLVPEWRLPNAVAFLDALGEGRRLGFEPVEVRGEDLAFLQYTGGTTGVAKGAELTHRNLVANTLQAAAWARPFFSLDAGVAVTPLPLYHVYSLTANLFCFVELGGHDLLITDPRDLKFFIKELRRHRFAFFTGVNTLFSALLRARGFAELDFSALRASMGGGMAVQRDVAERWMAVTGVPIAQGYGLTEASPIVTANPLDARTFDGSVGVPMPSTEVAICDDHGARLPAGEIGEICVKGPQVMRGYWGRPDETARVFFPGGWLRTGDIGRLDARGYLFIEDRKKDVIVVSGFKVYPNEVEDVVTRHPGVLEAAAVGVPARKSGEAVKLYVVKKDPALTAREIIDYCRENLTPYKVPHSVEFIDELPKSNVGKVLRRQLKEWAAAQAESQSPAAVQSE
ncbi:MAG TPA: AMP-binding protein [Gammaproteobacteria bacterium]|nr:AMP-binding protein [Gammaproteobacteria bacterium]